MQQPYLLNCKGRVFEISSPIVMGILNATPDSFYNRGRDSAPEALLREAEKMLEQGATILDIGGMSSRPGAEDISAATELNRVIPVLTRIKTHFPDCFISIDTFRTAVAEEAIQAGADMVNDITAGENNPAMLTLAAQYKTPYIAMHMQGKPATMQVDPIYNNVVEEVYDFFTGVVDACRVANVHDVILDPGFGFGKTLAHNFQLLADFKLFRQHQKPMLAGISRKSMVCKPLQVNPDKALNGTTALHMLALQNGADILRVHDVKEAVECIKLFENYRQFAD